MTISYNVRSLDTWTHEMIFNFTGITGIVPWLNTEIPKSPTHKADLVSTLYADMDTTLIKHLDV